MISMLPYFLLALLAAPTHALYFYLDGSTPKCFFEELPKDTLVVGHYEVLQYNDATRNYEPEPANVYVKITVDETFDYDHRIVNQRGATKGRFTFSAADSGEHKLCFTAENAPHVSGWLHSGQPAGNMKFVLDMAIGETSNIESTDKHKISDIVQKVKDLNSRLQDIRKEQVFQRVSLFVSAGEDEYHLSLFDWL